MKLKPRLVRHQIPLNVTSHDQSNKDHVSLLLKLTLLTLTGTLSCKLCEITNKACFKNVMFVGLPMRSYIALTFKGPQCAIQGDSAAKGDSH